MNFYIISMNRYIKFFLIILILLLYPVYSTSHPQDYKKFKTIEMEVLRDGKLIGLSKYFFKHKDDFLEVRNETKFEVELLGVKLFTINSKGIEKYLSLIHISEPTRPY